MTTDELKTLWRAEMGDAAAPFLWSDVEVYDYLDDAQKMFCRLTDGISDASTAAVTEIAVAAGATWLNLHPSIKKIRSASRASDGCDLTLVNHEGLHRLGLRLDPAAPRAPLRYVVTGMEEDKLRLVRPASAADQINLLVFRLPITTLGAGVQTLEIAAQHHTHLLSWARSRAYLKQDAEVFDEKRAGQFEDIFRGYCAQVQREQELKRHKGARTVGYGGI